MSTTSTKLNAGQFKPGLTPWNKGLHVRLSPKSEFKPGVLRGSAARNYCAVGTIKIINDHGARYRSIKIAEVGRRSQRWRAYARYLWEQANGPTPAGHKIMHDDGETLNDAMANLVCVDYAGAMALQRKYCRALAGSPKAAKATRQRHAVRREQKRRASAEVEAMRVPVEAKERGTRAQQNIAAFLKQLEAA